MEYYFFFIVGIVLINKFLILFKWNKLYLFGIFNFFCIYIIYVGLLLGWFDYFDDIGILDF